MEAQSAQSPTATSQPAVLAFQNVCVVELGRNRGGGRSDSSDSGSTTDDDSGGGSSTLRDVSGFAHAGEVVAFIEPGGSGGSTLLRALCGGGSPPATSTRTTARCRLLCVNGQKMPMGSLERAGVASLVQNGKQAAQSLHSLLTVHETLSFAAQLQLPRASQSSHPEQIRYIVNAMRMEHLEQDTVGSLSAGERRRLAIGCTLLLPPTLIFVDELTDGLHLHDAIMLCECLRTIARGKKYTIVVSIRQPTVELMQLLDRFTLLVGERMAFSGEMETAHQFVCANLVAEEAVPRSNSPTHVPHNDKMMAKPASMQRLLDALSHPVEAPAIAVAFTNSECSSELDRVLTAQQACVEDGFTRFTQKRSARSTGVQIAIALKREATVLWRFGEVTDVLREAVRTAILVGLIAFQLEKTAGSARSRLNLLSMLIDLPAYSEASWSKAFINSRPQNEQDMASRVLAPHSHAIVWAVLTMLRALGATVCTMVIAWPMISIGGSLNGWLETCGMMMTTKTIIQMITLWFSVRTDTWEAALRNMGPIYVIWYQCRGWFVRKQANTAASQWLMDYNPARNAWQRMSVLLFAGKDLPCHAAGNATARDGVHQLCPLPGELLLRHNSLEDDPSTDVTVPAVWVVVVLFIFYRAIFVKVAGGSPLKGPLMMCLASFCQRDDTDDNVSTPSGAYVGTTSKSPRKKRSKTSLSRSISVDIIDEVEQILNPPVHLELNALRLMTKDTGVIVQDVSGTVLPTTMMAVLGPSHAGKSSFLRVVAGIADGQVSGEIKVNGQPFDRLLQARIAAFVPQDDSSCLDVLTVEETLRNAADLQLSHASRTVRSTRIFDILRGLRLYKKRGTRLLDLDASEKRRVLIGANGLLTPSRLLLLDEPMRGLLPSDELALMRILSDMCKRFHFTVIFTACQPQTEVMSMADSVLLLSGATTVFNGPRTEIRRFFAAAGYPFGSQNEAVEMMKVASDRKSALTVSKHFSDQVCQATADSPVPVALTRTDLSFPRHFLSEVKALVRRDVLVQFREPMCSTSFVFNLLAFPCVFSLLYWRFEHNVANIEATAGVIWTMQSVWTTLCLTSSTMYYPSRWYPAHREAIRLCRYSIAASCVADTLVTCLRLFIGGYVLGVLQYHVVGLDAGRSFTDSLALVLPAAAVGLTADALSFCYVCCSRNSGRALTAVKMASVVDILSVFAGYYIQVSLLPYVSRQIATFNPIRAAYLLSMSAHFSNTSIPCGSVELADQSVPCPVEGDTAMQMLDVQNNPSTEAVNIVLLIAWPVGLRLIGAIALWNHVRRHRGLAVLEQSIQTAGVTCWYHTAMAIIAKPILWVFYRDLSVIGLDRLPSGPALIACNQSNAVMDQLFIANAFASIDYSIQLMLPAKILEEHSTGILKVIANALNVVPYRRADDYQKDGNGIIHRISLTDGQWSITGALFLRDMEEGCRLRGAWGEILHVQKLLSDKEAIIAEPNYPDRLIPSFRDYKMRVVMLEGGTLVNVHSTVGPWKYAVIRQLEVREAYHRVTAQLHNGARVAFPPESHSGDSPHMGRFQTELGVATLQTAATATKPEEIPVVVPVIIRWFNPHKMRSRAILEVGDPISVNSEMISRYIVDAQSTAHAFTDHIRKEMVRMQGSTRDVAELRLQRAIRRLLQPQGQLDAETYCKLCQFVWERNRELQDVATTDEATMRQYIKLLEDTRRYDTDRHVLGVADMDVRDLLARSRCVLYRVVVCQSLLFLVWLLPVLPGAVLSALPMLLSDWMAERSKRTMVHDAELKWGLNEHGSAQALDLVAVARLSRGLLVSIIFTIIYTTGFYIIAESQKLTWPTDVQPWLSLFVPIVGLLLVVIMIKFLDCAMTAAKAVRSATAIILADRAVLAALGKQRASLVERACSILGEFKTNMPTQTEESLVTEGTSEAIHAHGHQFSMPPQRRFSAPPKRRSSTPPKRRSSTPPFHSRP